MMDKTAVLNLLNGSDKPVKTILDFFASIEDLVKTEEKILFVKESEIKVITDFIEQQSTVINELEKSDIHREICMVEMGQKIAEYEHDELGYILTRYEEQSKYTELGQLALKFPKCPYEYNSNKCDRYIDSRVCNANTQAFCKLRDELLPESKGEGE